MRSNELVNSRNSPKTLLSLSRSNTSALTFRIGKINGHFFSHSVKRREIKFLLQIDDFLSDLLFHDVLL